MCYVSESGAVVATYLYDAFGNTIDQSGSLAATFHHKFSTKYHDAETEQYYYGRRFYIPFIGRWLNRDPIEEDGGENLYAFCVNDPIVCYDAYGTDWLEDLSNFCAGVGDSLTFGLTRMARRGINRMICGTWGDDAVDPYSKAYISGEVTEVAVEIAITAGGAVLRHSAKTATRAAVVGSSVKKYRSKYGLEGGFVHHVNPIKGHIGGKKARFPLPYKWAASGFWDFKWVPNAAAHRAMHSRLMFEETLDQYRAATMVVRQGVNRLLILLENNVGDCWDSLDLSIRVRSEAETSGEGAPDFNEIGDK